MIQKIKFTIITIILGLTLSVPVFAVGKANLTLSPASGEYQVGKTFNVSIVANTNEEKIDTVRAKVNFHADKLEITKFDFGPLYSYPAGGNTYDNNAGTLSQGAGHPGGTTQSGTFGTITFKVKAPGKAIVTVSSDSLMISAGKNKFTGKSFSASYNLTTPPPHPKGLWVLGATRLPKRDSIPAIAGRNRQSRLDSSATSMKVRASFFIGES